MVRPPTLLEIKLSEDWTIFKLCRAARKPGGEEAGRPAIHVCVCVCVCVYGSRAVFSAGSMDWDTISHSLSLSQPHLSYTSVCGTPRWPNSPTHPERLLHVSAGFRGKWKMCVVFFWFVLQGRNIVEQIPTDIWFVSIFNKLFVFDLK